MRSLVIWYASNAHRTKSTHDATVIRKNQSVINCVGTSYNGR